MLDFLIVYLFLESLLIKQTIRQYEYLSYNSYSVVRQWIYVILYTRTQLSEVKSWLKNYLSAVSAMEG